MGILTTLFPSSFDITPDGRKQQRERRHEMWKVLEELKEVFQDPSENNLNKLSDWMEDYSLEVRQIFSNILQLVATKKMRKLGSIPRGEIRILVEANFHTGIVTSNISLGHVCIETGLREYVKATGQNIVLDNHWWPLPT